MNNKIKRATRIKIMLCAYALLVLLVVGFFIFRGIALWFEGNTISFNRLVEADVVFNRPFEVKKREVVEIVKYIGQEDLDKLVSQTEKPELAKYICDKFGPTHCATAIAVAKAESGMRCDAVNININKTADLGVYQLNTVHLKKGGNWTLANMGDCYKNVDLAYELWQAQSWEPWVAWKNGSYLAHLSK